MENHTETNLDSKAVQMREAGYVKGWKIIDFHYAKTGQHFFAQGKVHKRIAHGRSRDKCPIMEKAEILFYPDCMSPVEKEAMKHISEVINFDDNGKEAYFLIRDAIKDAARDENNGKPNYLWGRVIGAAYCKHSVSSILEMLKNITPPPVKIRYRVQLDTYVKDQIIESIEVGQVKEPSKVHETVKDVLNHLCDLAPTTTLTAQRRKHKIGRDYPLCINPEYNTVIYYTEHKVKVQFIIEIEEIEV